jgi:2,3-bisphosphoglycerate-independent phosphoglycerate mutase
VGATGAAGTNLRGKADAALRALEACDLVFVHVDAPAATSLARDFVGKVETLERLDGYVLGPLLRAIEGGLAARLVVIGGEAAATETGRYLPDPVPFVIHGRGVRSTRRGAFSEVGARDAGFRVDQPHELLDFLLRLPA